MTGVLAPFLGDSQNVAPETTPDQGAYPPALRAILDQTADPSWNHQQPAGALAGALAAPQTPAEQTQRLQAAAQALVAARRSPTSASDLLGQVRQQTSGVNVPMLAAAGAFLQPTKTGGFGESLGNAMTTGASALQHQQQQQEQAALRAAMADDTAAYRERMADASNTRAEAYAGNVENLAKYRDLMANLKASGQDMTRSLAILRMEMTRDGVDQRTQAMIEAALIRAGASTYRTDSQTGVARDRLALDARKFEANAARWLASAEAKQREADLKQQGFKEAAIRTAMASAAKDPRLWTGKAKVDDLIAEYLKGHAAAGGGQGAAPTAGAAPAAAAPPPAKATPALREPSAAEQTEAQQWLKQNGDTPENRQYLNDQIKQRGLRPFL